ncbi:HNH endonuclease [Chitinophaga polysaccharea]|uniref:HNH endonuclease n=1 Tax=Chitinophaga polysaccharea TaxID=1293035 RepID=UPI00145518E2|nr:HNH endonuclease [Chitinophaga polysaccharea]NLR60720.1 HNH endonuclease [Chitinophaga polysaccharea]
MKLKMLNKGWYKSWVLPYIDTYGKSLEAVSVREGRARFRIGTIDTPLLEMTSLRDLYVCPLCLNRVVYRHQEYLDLLHKFELEFDFNVDHYPPEAIGGKDKILVCEVCNNKFGTTIDAAAKKFLEARFFFAGVNNSYIHMKIDAPWHKKPISGLTYWRDGVITTELRRGFNPPTIEPGPGPLQVQYSGKYPHDKIFRKALLRSAYLKCFAAWGYDFASSSIGKRLIAVFKDELEYPTESYGVFFTTSESYDNGIFQFENGGEIYFVVYFKIGIEEIPHYENVFVIIPSNTERSWEGLKYLTRDNKQTTLKGQLVPVKETVADGHFHRYRRDTKDR